MQVRSKDTDIQRLNIKIKRLEKEAEFRESIVDESLRIKEKQALLASPDKKLSHGTPLSKGNPSHQKMPSKKFQLNQMGGS